MEKIIEGYPPFLHNYGIKLKSGSYLAEAPLHEGGLILVFDSHESAKAVADSLDDATVMEFVVHNEGKYN